MARTVTASYPLLLYLLDHLLPYFSTAAGGVTAYPDDLLRAFSIPQPGLADVLRQVRDTLRDADAEMPPGRGVRHWPDPTQSWRGQCRRLADSVDLFLAVLDAVRAPELTEPDRWRLESRGQAVLALAAEVTAGYLAPAVLREHFGLVRELGPVVDRLRQDPRVAGAESWYAWII